MRKPLSIVLLLAAAAPAFAHPGHVEDGFAAGLLHPLTGIDHLLALLAAGLWSARQRALPGSAAAALPAAFLAAMAAGALAGMAGWRVPGLESALALTVLFSGALLAAAVTLPAPAGAALLAGFAVLHGNAHGLELPAPAAAAGYLLASALLLAIGHRASRALGLLAA